MNKLTILEAPDQLDEEEYDMDADKFYQDIWRKFNRIDREGVGFLENPKGKYMKLRRKYPCTNCLSEMDKYIHIEGNWDSLYIADNLRAVHPNLCESEDILGVTLCQECGQGHIIIYA